MNELAWLEASTHVEVVTPACHFREKGSTRGAGGRAHLSRDGATLEELKNTQEVKQGEKKAAPAVWRWAAALEASSLGVVSACVALPRLGARDAAAFAELTAVALREAFRLEGVELLEDDKAHAVLARRAAAPTAAVVDEPVVVSAAAAAAAVVSRSSSSSTARATRLRLESFVERVLVGLRQCPFTASKRLAGVGLEEQGVFAAPILYAHSDATTLAGLMADCWAALGDFLEGGERRYSSILLAAPHWDDKWDEWYRVVFPLLEASVLAAKAGRTVGLVCFHRDYETPTVQWLAQHRFGHQYSPQTLRRWLEDIDADFSATLSDQDLQFYGSHMRKAPHATLNVLWSRQLEKAEEKRTSRDFYVRNIKRLVAEGPDKLLAAAKQEQEQALVF